MMWNRERRRKRPIAVIRGPVGHGRLGDRIEHGGIDAANLVVVDHEPLTEHVSSRGGSGFPQEHRDRQNDAGLFIHHRVTPGSDILDIDGLQIGGAIGHGCPSAASGASGHRIAVFETSASRVGHDDGAIMRRDPVEVAVGDGRQSFVR